MPDPSPHQTLLRRLFDAAVGAADPAQCLPPHLPERPKGRTLVVGAGKAAASMAKAVEDSWNGPLEGLVITRYGHAVPTRAIEVVEAAHPVPDEAGQTAARRILEMAEGLGEDDLLLCLISGGGSALMAVPADGLALDDKQAINGALLRSGAPIDSMNAVRKHLSAIKGGRLAVAAWPAPTVTLLISDVPGDDPSTIASGPTVPDPTTPADARAILGHYGIDAAERVLQHLDSPGANSPPVDHPAFDAGRVEIVASPLASLRAAATTAAGAGYRPLILGDALEGEAREVGTVHAGIARSIAGHGLPVAPPAVLLSGGETTVTVRGEGRGGRNLEFLLGLGLALDDDGIGRLAIHALAADTDGIDGSEDNAGAYLGPRTLEAARSAGVDPHAAQANNDAHAVFAAAQTLVITGPTLTNVNDFRAVLIRDDQD